MQETEVVYLTTGLVVHDVMLTTMEILTGSGWRFVAEPWDKSLTGRMHGEDCVSYWSGSVFSQCSWRYFQVKDVTHSLIRDQPIVDKMCGAHNGVVAILPEGVRKELVGHFKTIPF